MWESFLLALVRALETKAAPLQVVVLTVTVVVLLLLLQRALQSQSAAPPPAKGRTAQLPSPCGSEAKPVKHQAVAR